MLLNQRELFKLFAPLAVSGLFFPLARPIMNAAMARSENPEQALAAFAVALSVTMPIISPLFALRQVTTALSVDRDMLGRIRVLTLALGGLSTLLALIVAVPQVYDFVVIETMGIPSDVARIAAPVLLILAFSPLLSVGRGYYQGILVHYNKAGPIGTGALVYVLAIAATLLIGHKFWSIEEAFLAAIASVVGQGFYIALVAIPSMPIIRTKMPAYRSELQTSNRSHKYLFLFYLPLAVSTLLGSIGEPAVLAAMARSAAPTASLAAFAVAGALGWLARTPLWNAQQVVIAQASSKSRYCQTRKFMIRMGAVSLCVLALLGGPGISDFVFSMIMGIEGESKALAISGFRWMLPLIFLQAMRSLYHGVLIRMGRAQQIQYATMAKMPMMALTLVLGVSYLDLEGIYIAIGSTSISECVEILYLKRAVESIHWPDNEIS
jgi:progressive ankylosis protein